MNELPAQDDERDCPTCGGLVSFTGASVAGSVQGNQLFWYWCFDCKNSVLFDPLSRKMIDLRAEYQQASSGADTGGY